MCLVIGNIVALKSTKDITVYKYVKRDIGEYVTACHDTKVVLNDTLKPDSETNIEDLYNKHSIKGGAIHACTTTIDSGFNCTCLKAIIKKGTTYYLQDDLKQVAATELYITDEVVTDEVTTPDMHTIVTDYLTTVRNNPEFTNKNGVHVGDYILSDKTFVSPLSEFNNSKAIGIVAFFDREDNPVVIALNNAYLSWLTDSYMRNEAQSEIKYDDVADDFDGKKHTEDIVCSDNYDPKKFEAVAYCANFSTDGTNSGDWYLGATGEVIKVVKNMGVINAAIQHTGVGEKLKFVDFMWTSSEAKSDRYYSTAWRCFMCSGECYDYDYRDSVDYVRPLYK